MKSIVLWLIGWFGKGGFSPKKFLEILVSSLPFWHFIGGREGGLGSLSQEKFEYEVLQERFWAYLSRPQKYLRAIF